MAEKILNILLVAMFLTFCVVFAVKTVLIDVVKDEKDAEWEANKDNVNTVLANDTYTLVMDERYE